MYFVLSVLICEGSIKSYKLQQKIYSIQDKCVHIEIHSISYFELKYCLFGFYFEMFQTSFITCWCEVDVFISYYSLSIMTCKTFCIIKLLTIFYSLCILGVKLVQYIHPIVCWIFSLVITKEVSLMQSQFIDTKSVLYSILAFVFPWYASITRRALRKYWCEE